MEFSQDDKKKLEQNIVNAIVSSLEQNQLKEEDLSPIATFVLSKIDSITTNDQLTQFVTELSTKWPVFKTVELLEKGEIREKKEDQVAQDVLTLAKNGNIDQAIDLAKTMTQPETQT